MIPLKRFQDKTIAVFGLGRSGLATASALTAAGAEVWAWDDDEAKRDLAMAQGVKVTDLDRADFKRCNSLVLSPGVPLYFPKPHRMATKARTAGTPIIGDVEVFAQALNDLPPESRPKVIGVTGTNGKSTTTALIAHTLKRSGRETYMGGNIGVGVLSLPPPTPDAHYVLELSSYQLDLTHSLRCDAAVFLNLTEDHLDRHGDMTRYLRAKTRIFRNQSIGDAAIIGVDDAYARSVFMRLDQIGGRTVRPISSRFATGTGVIAVDNILFDSTFGRTVRAMDLAFAPALKGCHNAQNAAAAYAACRSVGMDTSEIVAGLETFPGLEHRIEPCGVIDGVRFYNDSKATNPSAAVQAITAFPKVFLIAGGQAKSDGLGPVIAEAHHLAKAFLIGEAAGDFEAALAPHAAVENSGDLATATASAFAAARQAVANGAPEAVVLLSPACASFDQFRDFEQRGDHFKALVASLDLDVRQTA